MDGDRIAQDFAARRPGALEGAYTRWSKDFFSVAVHVTRDRALAEDCVHDALLRVWRADATFDGDVRSLRAYLMSCVRNEALSHLRSAKRRTEREARAARIEVAPAAEEAVDPIDGVRLQAALSRLPDEQRRALLLAYYGSRTQSEIAAELGIPLGTVKSRIALAMRKLQSELLPARRSA